MTRGGGGEVILALVTAAPLAGVETVEVETARTRLIIVVVEQQQQQWSFEIPGFGFGFYFGYGLQWLQGRRLAFGDSLQGEKGFD